MTRRVFRRCWCGSPRSVPLTARVVRRSRRSSCRQRHRLPDHGGRSITRVTDNSEDVVLVEQRDRILIITINRPEAKNAVNAAVSRGLADAVDRVDSDPGLSVGIVPGGGGSFCAGMALKAFPRGKNVIVEGRGRGSKKQPPVKPLIAAV